MNVLVTGAGGNLGRVLLPTLAAAGHAVRALDFRPLEVDHEFVQADLRDPDAAESALAGVDAVVHAAALHGVHLRTRTAHDYWSTNVTATFNVFEAARAAGVRRAVLCSSMAVYGTGAERRDGTWAVVTEETPALPSDVYGLSKLLCEELGRYYARTEAVQTVALRLGMFVPETFERYGFRLLFGGVDDRDVAAAVLLALAHEPRAGFDVFDVMADTPFGPDDARGLAEDTEAVLERYWPECGDLFRERGLDIGQLVWGRALWPIEKAQRELGYRPRYGFDQFLEALREEDHGHYPFAGLSQWGLEPD